MYHFISHIYILLSTDNKYILNCGLFLEETWKKDRGEDFLNTVI